MTTNVAGGLVLDRPTAGDFVSIDVDDHQLCWNPWAPPLLLNGRAAAIRDALDGSDLADTARLLAEIERRPAQEVLAELGSVVRSLALHGMLAESPEWARPTPAVLRRPITVCDEVRYQLGDATMFDLDLGSRRITISVAGGAVDRLRAALPIPSLAATEPLSDAPYEFAIVPAENDNDFHLLYGRGGRVYQRSLDSADITRSLISHLWSLQLADQQATDLVWLDAHGLVRDDAVILLPGPIRHLWPSMATRLTRAGYRQIESVQIGLDPATGQVVTPPPPPQPFLDALRALGIEPKAPIPSSRLTVAALHDMVPPDELEAIRASGHDTARLPLPLLTYRLALLAHRGASDTAPSPEIDPPRAQAILDATAALARQPQFTGTIHDDPRALLAALCS